MCLSDSFSDFLARKWPCINLYFWVGRGFWRRWGTGDLRCAAKRTMEFWLSGTILRRHGDLNGLRTVLWDWSLSVIWPMAVCSSARCVSVPWTLLVYSSHVVSHGALSH